MEDNYLPLTCFQTQPLYCASLENKRIKNERNHTSTWVTGLTTCFGRWLLSHESINCWYQKQFPEPLLCRYMISEDGESSFSDGLCALGLHGCRNVRKYKQRNSYLWERCDFTRSSKLKLLWCCILILF